MLIKLSPIRSDGERLAVSVAGEVVTINGEDFDFTPLGAGASISPAALGSHWFAADAARDSAGELVLTLMFTHGRDSPEEGRFPLPISVTADGPVNLPPADAAPEPEPEGEAP